MVEFQTNILRYLIFNRTPFLSFLDESLFDTLDLQQVFKVLKIYINKYDSLPEKANFVMFVKENSNITEDGLKWFESKVSVLFNPLKDTAYIKENLLNFVKKKMFKNALLDSLKSFEQGFSNDDINTLHTKISKIKTLDDVRNVPTLFLKQLGVLDENDKKIVYPFFLQGVNDLTSYGGFYPPQSIVIGGAPKSYKTGLMVKAATQYLKDGLDVAYFDFENGVSLMKTRFKHSLLECTVAEMSNFNNELIEIKDKLFSLAGGGELLLQKYRKKKDTSDNIKTDLEYFVNKGYNPKVLFIDYVDIMGSNKYFKNLHETIEHNYSEIDTINNEFNTFSFTVSKIKQSAFKSDILNPDDLGSSSSKIYDCHSAWAFVRSKDDKIGVDDFRDNIGRLQVLAQREGKPYTDNAVIHLHVNPELSQIKEIEI